MKFDQRISAATLSAAAALAFSPAAWSLGLGEASVESYLNQPLQARIDLISQASDDLTAITARLGSAEDYQLIGASLEAVPVPIRFTVEDIEGDAYLLATSSLPIDNPVLRLIVEVNWASGRMLREYTLFLDPPTVQESAPPPRIDQRETVASPPPVPVARPVEPPPSVAETPVEEPARQAPPIVTEQEYGPVQSGETLWEIASNWSLGSDVGINRAMIAIQRENPEAFVNGNINLLKRGAILRMPTLEEVENISSAAARREVIAHQERFAARRARATVAGGATPQLAEDRPPPPVDTEGAAPAAERVESEEPAVGEAPAETAGPAETEVARTRRTPPSRARPQREGVCRSRSDVFSRTRHPRRPLPPRAKPPASHAKRAGPGTCRQSTTARRGAVRAPLSRPPLAWIRSKT